MLKLSLHNRKMKALSRSQGVNTCAFNLTAGKTCSRAKICHAWVNDTGTVSRGKDSTVLCNMAKIEARYPVTRRAHAHNTQWIKTHTMTEFYNNMILNLDYHGIRICRIHASGDFISKQYFNVWVAIANMRPGINFFGYTKVYKHWATIKKNDFKNMRFVFSLGSHDDGLAIENNANTCTIVSPHDNFTGDLICTDKTNESLSQDYHYIMSGKSFGLSLK